MNRKYIKFTIFYRKQPVMAATTNANSRELNQQYLNITVSYLTKCHFLNTKAFREFIISSAIVNCELKC